MTIVDSIIKMEEPEITEFLDYLKQIILKHEKRPYIFMFELPSGKLISSTNLIPKSVNNLLADFDKLHGLASITTDSDAIVQ